MELWVRSQDRESLTKVSNVQYTYEKGDLYTGVRGKHYIGTYYDNLKILGTYETKERALEVLDEIEEKINLINLGHDFGSPMVDFDNPTYIYRMPVE